MTVKMVILGDSSVGKSCILSRLVRNHFSDFQYPTIGSAFIRYSVKTNKKSINLEIWDTAGQERYKSLASMYYQGAKIALIVYDVTNPNSLFGVKNWVKELRLKGSNDLIIAITGNKIDIKKQIYEDVRLYANENDILYFECSAKTNVNVFEMFQELALKVEIDQPELETHFKIDPVRLNKRNFCCI